MDKFKRRVTLNYDVFYLLGFIDINVSDYNKIIDYKTGEKKKEFQYSDDNYHQLHIYALSLGQE